MGAFGCHGNQFSSDLPPNLMQSFPHPNETPYEIWLQSAQWFLRRKCLKGVGLGSGELKIRPF